MLLTKRCGNCWESVGFIGEALSGQLVKRWEALTTLCKALQRTDNAL